MFSVVFYRDKYGKEPVKEYLLHLSARADKDSRIKLNKIRDYIKILSEYGTTAGEPYMKHISDGIWELCPLRERIFFAGYTKGKFVLLHQFMKTTQKTPKREIEKAKKNLADMLARIEYE